MPVALANVRVVLFACKVPAAEQLVNEPVKTRTIAPENAASVSTIATFVYLTFLIVAAVLSNKGAVKPLIS